MSSGNSRGLKLRSMLKGKHVEQMSVAALGAAMAAIPAASARADFYNPGDLVVSRSVYSAPPSLITPGQALPGGGNAVSDATYPNVWNNDTVDGSFGITSPIYLDAYHVTGTTAALANTLAINPNQISTSFSSKSELGLNLSTNGSAITFMGYVSPPNVLDVSNSNTPGHVDPTNPVTNVFQRAVGQIDSKGTLTVTPVNAYSGNNGRNAILANGNYYMVGNAGNGSGTPPTSITTNTGVQMVPVGGGPESTMVGNFNVTQYGYPADKPGKDNNFRGETIFNNTLYVTKGSGGNGINTVYQVGNAGSLPTLSTASSTPITILPGMPTNLAKSTNFYPFGLFFANANTLYVADEGDGKVADAATDANAGLEKWSLVNGSWQLDYVLQNGLNIGTPYTVANYPAALSPATDGLRNITGVVNPDGTVTLYGVTSTVSASGDQGGDPNKLVAITDSLNSMTLPANETFSTLETAPYGQVLRGVALTSVPEPSTLGALALAGAALLCRRSRRT